MTQVPRIRTQVAPAMYNYLVQYQIITRVSKSIVPTIVGKFILHTYAQS